MFKLTTKIPSLARALERAGKKVSDRALSRQEKRVTSLVVARLTEAVERTPDLPQKRYRDALRAEGAVKVTDRGVVVDIQDPALQGVEGGRKAFSIKQKMLARATKRSRRTGEPYVDVPFRHRAKDVPRDITAEAKAKAAATGRATVRVARETPGKQFERSLHRGVIGRALGLGPRKQQVAHARGIHDDILRTSTGRGRGSYTTIRRISLNSAPSSWWHPGFKGQRVLLKAWAQVRKDVLDMLKGSK